MNNGTPFHYNSSGIWSIMKPAFQASGFHMTLGLLNRQDEDEGWDELAKVWFEQIIWFKPRVKPVQRLVIIICKDKDWVESVCLYIYILGGVPGGDNGWREPMKDNRTSAFAQTKGFRPNKKSFALTKGLSKW